MGIENTPGSVDDLNESWPAITEPAKEGAAHLRSIKRAVKARANVAGRYGVTTLSSATDSDLEDRAATPAAIKALKAEVQDALDTIQNLADGLQGDFANLDTSLPDGGLAPIKVWNVEAGNQYKIESSEVRGEAFETPTELYNNYIIFYKFVIFSSGSIRLFRKYSFGGTSAGSLDNGNGQIGERIVKNGTIVQGKVLTGINEEKTETLDISVTAGDLITLECRQESAAAIVNNSSASPISGFRLKGVKIGTTGLAPLVSPSNRENAHSFFIVPNIVVNV